MLENQSPLKSTLHYLFELYTRHEEDSLVSGAAATSGSRIFCCGHHRLRSFPAMDVRELMRSSSLHEFIKMAGR